KMSPMGLMAVPTLGAKAPMSAPTTMPPKIRIRLPYCCQKVFCLMMLDDVDMIRSLPFRSQGVHGGLQLCHGLFQGGAGAGRVQPHIAAQAAAEGVALVQA